MALVVYSRELRARAKREGLALITIDVQGRNVQSNSIGIQYAVPKELAERISAMALTVIEESRTKVAAPFREVTGDGE